MTATLISVQIPQPIYHRLEQAATRLQKPVEELLVETLEIALPPTDEIPANIRAEVASLDELDTVQLCAIAESDMASDDQQALDHLLDLQGLRPLTEDEQAQLDTLRTEYGRILLRKARAFALLTERGQPLPLE